MKNSLDSLNSRFEILEKKISESEERWIGSISSEEQRFLNVWMSRASEVCGEISKLLIGMWLESQEMRREIEKSGKIFEK